MYFSSLQKMPPKKRANAKANDNGDVPKNAKERKISPPVNVSEEHRQTILTHVREHVDTLFIKEFTPAFTKQMWNSAWTKVWDMLVK